MSFAISFSDDDEAENNHKRLDAVHSKLEKNGVFNYGNQFARALGTDCTSARSLDQQIEEELRACRRKPMLDVFLRTIAPAKNLFNPYDIEELEDLDLKSESHRCVQIENKAEDEYEIGKVRTIRTPSSCRKPFSPLSLRRARLRRAISLTPKRTVAPWKLWSTVDSDIDEEYSPEAPSTKRRRTEDIVPDEVKLDIIDENEAVVDTPKRVLRNRKAVNYEKWESEDELTLGDVQDNLRLKVAIQMSLSDSGTPSPASSNDSEDRKPLLLFVPRRSRDRERSNVSQKTRSGSAGDRRKTDRLKGGADPAVFHDENVDTTPRRKYKTALVRVTTPLSTRVLSRARASVISSTPKSALRQRVCISKKRSIDHRCLATSSAQGQKRRRLRSDSDDSSSSSSSSSPDMERSLRNTPRNGKDCVNLHRRVAKRQRLVSRSVCN